jgi:transposase
MASKLDPHLQDIKVQAQDGASQRELAEEYGVGRTTMREFLSKHDITTAAKTPPLWVPGEEAVPREAQLEQEVRDLRSALNSSRKTAVLEERILDHFREVIDPAAVQYQPAERDPDKPYGIHKQALLLSDLHAGEVVNAEEMNDINEYDFEILVHERLPNIHKALTSYKENRPYQIDELQIWMLGDMVGGDIHDELAATNDYPVAEQTYQTGMLLGQFVEQLVPHYPRIRVICVEGNHGRVTKKPAAKQVFNSFDYLAYRVAELYTVNYDSVSWQIARGGQTITEIAGQRYLLFHGDGIRSTMPGVPWGGVVRRTNELKKQYASHGVLLDGFALGHFHQANAVAGGIFMNGSVKGPDEYTLKAFGGGQDATQLLLTFNPTKRRVTDVSYINP